MSFAVLRGEPVAAQLYLDTVLDDILKNGKTRPGVKTVEDINLAEVLYHSMQMNPNDVRLINGATGEKFSNQRILERSVSLARALRARGVSGKTVIIMLQNHEHMLALYYAVILAGVVPFMIEPSSTEYEIQQSLSLVCPYVVFCEPERRDEVVKVARTSASQVVVANGPSLDKFSEGATGGDGEFEFPDVDPESAALLLPTSGSTGSPKAAILTHRGLTIQVTGSWLNYSQFPRPTRLGMLLSTGQWMTHSLLLNSCTAYGVPVLVTSEKVTPQIVLHLIDRYKPTALFAGPSLLEYLGYMATSEQLSCIELALMGGSSFIPESLGPFQRKLSKSALCLNVYGITESQGVISMGTRATPIESTGKVVNFIDYKLVDDNGEELIGATKKGELYLKSRCLIKGYLKNEAAYKESLSNDGWLKTGDVFYKDEEDQLFFVNRTKLSIKYLNHHVYPEELERVIGSVPGVLVSVVCGLDAGPAAAVVLKPGCDVTREAIHRAVDSKLSDYKRLRGGIAFVKAIPRNYNGKVNRIQTRQILKDLATKGDCL